MDTKTPSPDFEECDKNNDTEDPVHIIVGICAMNKKVIPQLPFALAVERWFFYQCQFFVFYI